MIIPLFVPSRWRSRAVVAAPAPYEATPAAYPDLAATQTMAGGDGLAGRLGRDQAAAPDGARPFAGALGSGGSRDPGRPGSTPD